MTHPKFIAQHRIHPQLHLSGNYEHESRLFALAARLDREAGAFFKEALEDLLPRYEAKTFGALLATQPSPESDRPLLHARLVNEPVPKPPCGASDGPGPLGVRVPALDLP